MNALGATEDSILTWHLLADGECYADPGADHFPQPDPVKAKNNAIKNSTGSRLRRHHHPGHRSLRQLQLSYQGWLATPVGQIVGLFRSSSLVLMTSHSCSVRSLRT